MKPHTRFLIIGAVLCALSALAYTAHYFIFHEAHHIFIYLVGDIAFVPVEVFLVALVLERALAHHEKKQIRQKLNMVIGTFFSELGTKLLGKLTPCIDNRDELRECLAVKAQWKPAEFKRALGEVRRFKYKADVDKLDLHGLKDVLSDQRGLLLTLLANPNLLEHERFTNLLWAVFHLMEELEARDSLDDMPGTDRLHVAGDVVRVYEHLTAEWLLYCQHLKKAYPYIFSIVVRTHPLQDTPNATVTA